MQVAALEARLEEKRCVVRPLQVVVLVQAIEVASVDHLSVMQRCAVSALCVHIVT